MSKKIEKELTQLHKSVLLDELVDNIKIHSNKQNIIVDCTLWMWWHAKKIIENLNKWDIFIWFDADIRNLDIVRESLEKVCKSWWVNVFLINDNFENLKTRLEKLEIKKITWIYYDLWISSLHVDDSQRWFSFKLDWPLDMRFDNSKWINASQIINSYSKDELINIFREYWEEPSSRKIAEKILEKRKTWFRFKNTLELSKLIQEVSKYPKSKNRIFQALRIEVNQELETIKKSINDAITLLDKWWSIFIISFHSLEDRIVKNILKTESKDCICRELICNCNHTKKLKIITKKPIIPKQNEVKENPRSRSAKARCAVKI